MYTAAHPGDRLAVCNANFCDALALAGARVDLLVG